VMLSGPTARMTRYSPIRSRMCPCHRPASALTSPLPVPPYSVRPWRTRMAISRSMARISYRAESGQTNLTSSRIPAESLHEN
jgi:hypothetical protein